jgi:hypothetical protein
MVTDSILTLTESLKNTPALALTPAQVTALEALSAQIEWALQERAVETQDADQQVEDFEMNEFLALDAQCAQEDRFLDSFWESQTECFGMD